MVDNLGTCSVLSFKDGGSQYFSGVKFKHRYSNPFHCLCQTRFYLQGFWIGITIKVDRAWDL